MNDGVSQDAHDVKVGRVGWECCFFVVNVPRSTAEERRPRLLHISSTMLIGPESCGPGSASLYIKDIRYDCAKQISPFGPGKQ